MIDQAIIHKLLLVWDRMGLDDILVTNAGEALYFIGKSVIYGELVYKLDIRLERAVNCYFSVKNLYKVFQFVKLNKDAPFKVGFSNKIVKGGMVLIMQRGYLGGFCAPITKLLN